MVQLVFNARGVTPNVGLEPVPSGTYPVIITRSEEKPTKSGNGSFVEMELTIQGGQFANRKVYDRLNIKNPNQQAVDIAYATLSAICHVTGCLEMQDTQQLHGKPFQAVVIKKERDDQKGVYSNEVRGYKDIHGNDPGQTGQSATPAAQPSWAGNGAQSHQSAPAQGQPHQQAPAGTAPQGDQGYQQQPQYQQNNGGQPGWAGGGQPPQSQQQGVVGQQGGANEPPPWAQRQ